VTGAAEATTVAACNFGPWAIQAQRYLERLLHSRAVLEEAEEGNLRISVSPSAHHGLLSR
jgi:hypothetical protein